MDRNDYQIKKIDGELYLTTPASFESIEEEFSHLGIEVDPLDWPRWENGRRCKLDRLSRIDGVLLRLRY
jgi:hypothetical protein